MNKSLFILIHICCLQAYASNSIEPQGEFNIASKRYFFIDSTRAEILTKNSNDYRRIVFQTFYPTDKIVENCSQITAPYGNKIKYYHCLDKEILHSNDKYPIIILSPGFGGSFLMNMTLAEEIASQGYFVINVGHTFFNDTPTFPDNTKIELLSMDTLEMTTDNFLNPEFKLILNRYIKIQKNDIKSLLNNLHSIIDNDCLNEIDLDKIACVGYSGGGATAAEICAEDDRIKAGVNINGVLYGDSYRKSINQPFLYVNADYINPKKAEVKMLGGQHVIDSLMNFYNQRKSSFIKNSINSFYELTIKNTTHHNFSDYALVNKSYLGNVNREECLQITYKYIVAFLDSKLKQKTLDLLSKPYENNILSFEIKND